MKTQFFKAALAVGISLALIFSFSCSSGGGDNKDGELDNDRISSSSSMVSGSVSSSSVGDVRIVNANNEAWIWCGDSDYCTSMIFKPNGELVVCRDDDDGNWNIKYTGTYSIEENQLTRCYDDDDYCNVSTYSISENTLIIRFDGSNYGYRYTFFRKSGEEYSCFAQ